MVKSSWEYNGWSVSRQEPVDATPGAAMATVVQFSAHFGTRVELCVRWLVCPHSSHLNLCMCLYIELISPRTKEVGYLHEIYPTIMYINEGCRSLLHWHVDSLSLNRKNYSYEVVILVFIPLRSKLPHHSPITTSCEASCSLLLTNQYHAEIQLWCETFVWCRQPFVDALKIVITYPFTLGARIRSVGAVTGFTRFRTRFQRKRFFVLRSVQPSCGGPSS